MIHLVSNFFTDYDEVSAIYMNIISGVILQTPWTYYAHVIWKLKERNIIHSHNYATFRTILMNELNSINSKFNTYELIRTILYVDKNFDNDSNFKNYLFYQTNSTIGASSLLS